MPKQPVWRWFYLLCLIALCYPLVVNIIGFAKAEIIPFYGEGVLQHGDEARLAAAIHVVLLLIVQLVMFLKWRGFD